MKNIDLTSGTYQSRFKAWGEYIETHSHLRLKVKEHEELYKLGKEARKNGWTDTQIDEWLKDGRQRARRLYA